MIKRWAPTFVGVVAVAGILMFSLQQIFVKTTLNEQEVINRVESLYNGTVEDITKNPHHYNVVFSDGTKVYEVQVDEEQGTFNDLTLLADRASSSASENEQNNEALVENENNDFKDKQEVATAENGQTPPDSPKPNSSSPPANTGSTGTSTGSSSESASGSTQSNQQTNPTPAPAPQPAKPVQISASSAEQIALKQMNGELEDTKFYNTADGGYYIVEVETEEQEAAFQIHAITGKILSVVYDD